MSDDGEWMRVSSYMDSGCVDSVAPPSLAPFVPASESPGSRRGQEYTVANGEPLPNLGEKLVEGVDKDGNQLAIKYQIAEVTRPLNSISEICDNNSRVVFRQRRRLHFQCGHRGSDPICAQGEALRIRPLDSEADEQCESGEAFSRRFLMAGGLST